jgi:hypothetical protein
MHRANDIELDDNTPVNTFFSECCGCIDTLELAQCRGLARLALAQEEYTNYSVFLMGLPFDADSLVDGLRDASSFIFASNAYCSSLG